MEKGQLRCDCNVSVRREHQTELGAKIETQELELDQRCAARARLRDSASDVQFWNVVNRLEQETRGWDDVAGETFLMRTQGIRARLPLFS